MNRHHVSAAVVLASAAAFLTTACASSSASPSPAARTPAASNQPTAASGSAGGDRQPCHLPAGYDHFFKLDSAETFQGNTVLRVTPEKCSVNPDNDEDVDYTPIDAARSFVLASGASVKVLGDSATPESVSPTWLVHHQLANTPYFYYRVNGHSQITAMQEIYHP